MPIWPQGNHRQREFYKLNVKLMKLNLYTVKNISEIRGKYTWSYVV